jgi:transcriptional regulator with PAS, ATPase and Fis domain
MLESSDVDLTLPSITASARGAFAHQDQQLVLTIAFHPDTARIGQRAVVPKQSGNTVWVLGRRSPAFGAGDVQSPTPLDDPHVSRRALQFTYQDKRLLIRRFDASSRCRVGDAELLDSVDLDVEQLLEGVPLLLSHSIVLVLRLGPGDNKSADAAVAADVMRGSSACMGRVREQVARAATSDLDVLVRGETGTGKELVATIIHRASARGAFTGADKAATGYFEQAEGGTLFLDEIGDTSPEVQPQLLRALQQREIQAVGGRIRQVDLRVISATDAALEEDGVAFKAALRYRLGACEIVLPPLRDHPEDVGELLLYFLRSSAVEAGRTELLPHAQSPALDIAAWANLFFHLLTYRWPGNVRELANIAQQIVLSSEHSLTLSDSLQAMLSGHSGRSSRASNYPARRRMRDISDEVFESSMVCNDFEALQVSRQLGVSRTAVYRRIETSVRYRLAGEIQSDELQRVLLSHEGDCTGAARELRVSVKSLRSRLRKLRIDGY